MLILYYDYNVLLVVFYGTFVYLVNILVCHNVRTFMRTYLIRIHVLKLDMYLKLTFLPKGIYGWKLWERNLTIGGLSFCTQGSHTLLVILLSIGNRSYPRLKNQSVLKISGFLNRSAYRFWLRVGMTAYITIVFNFQCVVFNSQRVNSFFVISIRNFIFNLCV